MCTATTHAGLPRSRPDALRPDGGMFYMPAVQLVLSYDVDLRTIAATLLPTVVLPSLFLLGLQGQ